MITTKLIASDLMKRVSESKHLKAQLLDQYGNPMAMETVVFTVNGRSYNRDCDDNGYASLNINLPVGIYTCTIQFQTVASYSGCSKTVTVTVVEKYPVNLDVSDLTKNYGEQGQVVARLTLTTGESLKNRSLTFSINGVNYTRTTDSNGIAKLNINLPRGVYSCTVKSLSDEIYDYKERTGTVRIITTTHMDGTNISKMEDELAVYQCAVYDEIGRVQCDVQITVNGVTYNRHTESDGLAKLNIRLPAGEYDIIARFAGDSSHTGSYVINHISSKKYAQELTTNTGNGVWTAGDNTGVMESHVQVKQWSPEAAEAKGGVLFWDDTGQDFHKDIAFKSYEITETDPRVKTAKFVTNEYFDLTAGQLWVHISNPYHENFGGRILKVDFNKDNGLYTYQCQDGRRNYMNKGKAVIEQFVVYDLLRLFLIDHLFMGRKKTAELEKELIESSRGQKLLSGLRPLDAYDLAIGVIKQNSLAEQATELLSYDSTMEKIMNFAHNNGAPTDVYFTPEGVCQIDPIDMNTWIKSGFKVTHSDLTSYKYGFDTTNILTGVNFQTTDNTPIVNVDSGKTINEELQKLGFYFGANIGMISPVTESVTTTDGGDTNSSGGTATGMNKGKTVVVACDINSENDGHVLGTVCYTLENAGYDVINLGIGPGLFSSYDYSGSSRGKVGVYLMAGSTVSIADGIDGSGSFDYYVFGLRGDLGLRSTTQFDSAPWGYDDDCTSICDRWVGHTGAEIAQMARDSGKGDVVVGNTAEEIANAVLAAVNGESGVSGSTTSTTQKINVAESYRKAQEEVVKAGRDLLSFEVKLPLNHTMFKNLHTNQMFFTELPKEFKLGNLAELFKILPTYKINRGLGTEYQENRWYIEKQVIKCDEKGLFSTLTLNVLPSPYSVYTEKLRSYRDAYEQAFKQQENAGSGSSGGGAGNARLGDDSTDTNSMACATGRYYGHAGDNENFDSCAQKGYAREGASYFDWSRQFSTPIELAKALNDRIEYHDYSGNEDGNAEQTFNAGAGNCYDGCRLVKCCMDAAGFDCIVVTGTIYNGGHGWNAVKWNGRWYTFDLFYDYTSAGDWAGTNTLRLTNEW